MEIRVSMAALIQSDIELQRDRIYLINKIFQEIRVKFKTEL